MSTARGGTTCANNSSTTTGSQSQPSWHTRWMLVPSRGACRISGIMSVDMSAGGSPGTLPLLWQPPIPSGSRCPPEPDTLVQGGGCVCLVGDLHPLGASRDKAIDPGGQHRLCETSPLSGRTSTARAGDPPVGGLDSEVERRVVERTLVGPLRHAVPVSVGPDAPAAAGGPRRDGL